MLRNLSPGKSVYHSTLVCVFWVALLSPSFAQNSRIDSLKALMPALSQDTNKVNTLVELALESRNIGDSVALRYGREAYALAGALNFSRGRGYAALQIGRYLQSIEKNEEALKYHYEALGIFKELGNLNGVAGCHTNIGGVYYRMAKYELARDSYQKALLVYEKTGDKKGIARVSGNIGITYEGQGQDTKALDAYFRSLRMNEQINYKEGMAYNFMAIAISYDKQDDHAKSVDFHQKALDVYLAENDPYGTAITHVNMGLAYSKMKAYTKALDVLNTALLSFRKLKYPGGEATALHNIGSVYFRLGNFPTAVRYFRKALDIRSETDDSGRANDLAQLSEAYVKIGKADSAFYFAKRGLVTAEKINSISSQLTINKALYDAYKAKHDAVNSLRYLERYMANKDTIFSKEKNALLRDLQLKYETEKKEQLIAMLNNEKALQESKFNNRILLLGVSIAVTLIVIIFLFITIRSNRRRQESERLLLNEQLRNKNMEAEKLQELDELKSRFFANIAHEFRTPLTLISGPVENLLGETKDKYSRDQLMLVKSNSTRLLELINQMLDLSRLESGVSRLVLQKDNVVAFLQGLTFSFQSLADEKEIDLECHTAVDELTMDFDRDKLETILSNLLSNAFKFTPDLGSIEVAAAPVLINGHEYVEIKVADSGVGIPEDQLPFIFNRFYQADNAHTGNSQGSGIGLALTKELVELHGGTIDVASAPGSGTIFTVSLPVRNDVNVKQPLHESYSGNGLEHVQQQETAMEQEPVHPQEANAEIVLVIEDNPEVRNFIITCLRNSYRVIAAADGDEGIAMACDVVPDLIISDVMMPGKNGYDTCRILKEDQRTSHIPVILLTAKAGLENKMEGLETGADDFIAKPFSTRELQARVRNLITIRRKLREKYLDAALSEDKPGTTIEDVFLIKIRGVIEARLDDSEFSVEDLCREIGMSRTQVHRKLKALTNQSASQFIRILKLQHGKILLQQGQYNVSEVADRVGFASLTYFSSSYASHFGYAPSEEKRH